MKKMNIFSETGILRGKRVFLLTCVFAVLIAGTSVSLASSGTIKSQGRIVSDNDTVDTSDDVIFDASDLTLIETQIDTAKAAADQGKENLVETLKDKLPPSIIEQLPDNPTYEDIANAISSIGQGANVTEEQLLEGIKAYDGTEVITGTMPNLGALYPDALAAGESLTIPKGFHSGEGNVTTKSLASQTGVTGTYINDHDTDDTSDDTEDNLVAATADNLSLGTAAWVDGQYIVGTGEDNNSYYTQGYNDKVNTLRVVPLLSPASGTGTIDVSSYPGSENFTTENFFVKFITGSSYAYFEVDGMYEKSGGSGNLSTPILSYDSNNRKLTYTVETNKNSVIYNDGHVSSNTSVNVTLGIYLIYFE